METTDLDFLARKIGNDVNGTKIVFEKIANIDLQNGFLFNEIKASELTHPHMGYPGVAVGIMAHFGKTRFKVTIDIGFVDIVNSIVSAAMNHLMPPSLFRGKRDLAVSTAANISQSLPKRFA
ncbi:MAG: hypothetical protein ACSNEK_08870 [Parachlamydiaceae bacterium]